MSRPAQSKSSPIVKTEPGTTDKKDEICPVCKTSKYIRPNMVLMINPACYHIMCESCADRLFGHGPAKCPMKNCSHFLRRNKFRKPTFDDIQVEREVDIRQKVAVVFNKQEEDFESLRDYNDYLNDVEDITFNMINGIDAEETNRRFEQYQRLYEQDLRANARPDEQEQLDFLASSKAGTKSGKESQIGAKKRAGNKSLPAASTVGTNGSSNLVIKGLRAKVKPAPEAPIDPFGGIRFAQRYYSIQDKYSWIGLQEDPGKTAGGYSYPDFTNRILCEAFSGLGVVIADEAEAREGGVVRDVETEDVKMEDPF